VRISKVDLIDFKSFEKQTIELGDNNRLVGANGVGKSSIIESIIAGYYGKLVDGSSDVSKLIKDGAREASITITDDKGTFTRIIKKSGSEIVINGSSISESNFSAERKMVDLKYFLSATSPDYWLNLDYKDRRSIVSELSPEVDVDKLFLKTYPKPLLERFKRSTYSQVNKEIRELEDDLLKNKTLLQQTSIQDEGEANNFNSEEFEELESRHIMYNNVYKDVQLLEDAEIWAIEKAERDNATKEKIGLLEKLKSIKLNIKVKGQDITDAQVMELVNQIPKIKIELESLYAKQRSLNTGECVTCGQLLEKTIEDPTDRISDLENRLQKLERLVQEMDVIKEKREEILHKIELAQVRIDNNKSIKEQQNFEEVLKQKDKIVETYEHANWSDELEAKYQKLKEEQLQSKGAEDVLKKQLEEKEELVKAYKVAIDAMKEGLEELKLLQQALSPKGIASDIAKEQVKHISKYVAKYADNVVIETIEPLKSTDGVREVFNVFQNDIQEKKLSTGQKVMLATSFSLALQDMILDKLDRTCDLLIIDNSSLISEPNLLKIDKLASSKQRIYAINSEDKLLKIEK
jgi:DNA repair exonuclease SbcCD ATPase subunit